MEALKCPSCGSSDLSQLSSAEFRCLHCGTGFVLTHGKTGFVDVVLVQTGKKSIEVIQALREVSTKENTIKVIDLAMAKRLTDGEPCVVVPNVPSDVGERVKARLEKAGATVELKPA